ncbi:phage antirepressor KilAC domain-containing protein [Bacillus cereus]|uniref:phage antirepressor KilAC domain-containing protein n=1 Tax=Bacillus TaxID=1386 RepID=UPI000BFC42C8|nr:phage antirepressor KilAC domain-containing protein [Bacillus cereus]MCU5440509.1 phage antirepressor KilAC domain-containing protein [Bacillus cereus]PGZ17221.1 hypothetical protein COE46_09560 [Bacillus cereus]
MKNTKIKIELNEEFYPQAKKSAETPKNNVVPFPTAAPSAPPIVAAADQVDVIENIDQDALINPENADLRDKYIERVEALDLVKGLLLLPNSELATADLLAKFYKVPINTIRTIYKRHRDELESDGMILKSGRDLDQYRCLVHNEPNKNTGISTRTPKAFLFPKRAILRIGMLLRDSEVAKEVRTQLLNIEGNATDQQRTKEIDHELELQAAIGKAIMSGDVLELAQATTKMADYKNRHIAKITEERDEARAEIDEINGKELISMENVGKDYIGDISAMKLNRFLQDQKVLAKDKTDGHYTANLKYARYFRTSTYHHNGKIRKSLKATREGAKFIADLYEKHAKGGDQNATK